MNRSLVLACALLLGSAAPLRAWCEVTCLAPAAASEPHCPSHEPAGDTTAISASGTFDCPVLESARTTSPARLDLQASLITSYVPATAACVPLTTARASRLPASTVFKRCTPLRI